MGLVENRIAAAREAALRREWREALLNWNEVIAEAPDRLAGYLGRGHALSETGQLDEAELTFKDAMERFQTELWPAASHAQIAVRRRNWPEALRRYEKICEEFPDNVAGPLGMGGALLQMNEMERAEAVFAKATTRFPEDAWLASGYARAAETRGDWLEALRRYRRVREKFPDNISGYLGLIATFRGLRRLNDADAIAQEAVRRWPHNEWVALSFAQIAMARQDWGTAAQRWQQMLENFPGDFRAIAGKVETLIEAGNTTEAQTVLTSAAESENDQPDIARVRKLLNDRRASNSEQTNAPIIEFETSSISSTSRPRLRKNSYYRRYRS